MKNLSKLLSLAKPFRGALSLVLLLTTIAGLLELVAPWLLRAIINLLTQPSEHTLFHYGVPQSLTFLLLLWLGILIITNAVSELGWYLYRIVWQRFVIHLNFRTMEQVLGLSLEDIENIRLGKLVERLGQGVYSITNLVYALIIDLLPAAIRFLAATAILWLFDFRLAVILIAALPVFVLFTLLRGKILAFWEKTIRNTWESIWHSRYNALAYADLVRVFSREDFETRSFRNLNQRLMKATAAQERGVRYLGFIRNTVSDLSQVGVVALAAFWVLRGRFSVGDLVLFAGYVTAVFAPFWQLTRIYDEFQRGMVAVRRVFKFLSFKPKVVDIPGARGLKVREGKIEFKNVSFRYRSKYRSERVFSNLSVVIEPRQVVALVGPSGVGKSTFIKLLMRLYDVDKGTIMIDGQDIRKILQRSVREQVAVVMQDTAIFNNTIKYNIRYGKPTATRKELERAAKTANFYDFVQRLPKKWETVVGERGIKLSGGERQRVSIARAVLKNAPILVLDEATSSLDSESERLVQDAIWELIKGRTAVIIAHRLSTVRRADRILVFDKGKIIEDGSHEELMKKKGYYAKMFKMQSAALLK